MTNGRLQEPRARVTLRRQLSHRYLPTFAHSQHHMLVLPHISPTFSMVLFLLFTPLSYYYTVCFNLNIGFISAWHLTHSEPYTSYIYRPPSTLLSEHAERISKHTTKRASHVSDPRHKDQSKSSLQNCSSLIGQVTLIESKVGHQKYL